MKKTVFRKIFGVNILLVAFSLILYCTFVFFYEYETNKKSAMQESVELTNKMNRALRDYFNQVDGMISSFYYEIYQNETGALATFFMSEEQSGVAKAQQVKNLDQYFAKLFLTRNDFIDIYIFLNDEKTYVYSSYGGQTLDYQPQNAEWYWETLEKNGKTNIMFNYVAEQITYAKPVIGFSRMFKNINEELDSKDIVVVLDFKMEAMEEMFDNYITNDMTSILLVDEDGNIVYQRGAESRLKEYWKENELRQGLSVVNQGASYITACSDQKVYEWNVVVAVDMQYIMRKVWDYVKYAILVFLILLLCASILSFISARSISRPIKVLMQGMHTVQEGNFDIHLNQGSEDEIGQLIEHFNVMTSKIKQLIREKYEEELQKKEAQYKFLQAQIDPHFIFNTLQIISNMALVYQIPDIRVVSNSLAELIRYSISEQEKTIYLENEIKNVKSYLNIQQIRFKNRLSYEIEMEPTLGKVSIIKLLLQPIVENGIVHGLQEKKEKGMIRIKVFDKQDHVYIQICDNGIGMNQAELHALMQNINRSMNEQDTEKVMLGTKRKGNQVGLRNINLRLKMYYGEEYGLKIESEEGKGTVVTVCISREEGNDGKTVVGR